METPAHPDGENVSLEERIRSRAYELYLQRGGGPGSELDDWLQAEEDISRRLRAAAAGPSRDVASEVLAPSTDTSRTRKAGSSRRGP